MREFSDFRGLAGDTVASFVMPGTVVQGLPAIGASLVAAALVAGALPVDIFPMNVALALVIIAFAVSRFAIPGIAGELTAGWFDARNSFADSADFCLRYALFTFAWGLPACAYYIALTEFGGGLPPDLSPTALVQSGISGFAILVLAMVCLFAPTLGFIACTVSKDAAGLLSLQMWHGLLFKRQASLVVFYGALFGGVVAFAVIYAFPLVLVTSLGYTASDELGDTLALASIGLPCALMPLLIGRLCGAIANDEIQSATGRARRPTATPAANDDAGDDATSPYARMMATVRGTPVPSLPGAIANAASRVAAQPDDAWAAAELCLLHMRAGDYERALEVSSRAVVNALTQGAGEAALECYIALQRKNHTVPLDRDHSQKMVGLMVRTCNYQAALKLMLELEVVTPQRLQSLADLAVKNGCKDDALAIADHLSTYDPPVDFLESLLQRIKVMESITPDADARPVAPRLG